MEEPVFVPHQPWRPDSPPEVAAKKFYQALSQRRSIRHFSDAPVSLETMEWVVRSAASAPSGANKQPWRFVCVQDADLKKKIRSAAEVHPYAIQISLVALEDPKSVTPTLDIQSFLKFWRIFGECW